MVSISPRLREFLDYEDPDTIDPRLSAGLRSTSLDFELYESHDVFDTRVPAQGSPDSALTRRRRRQRQNDSALNHLVPFEFKTIPHGDIFRLAVIHSGTGTSPVQCHLIWESCSSPRYSYECLSYCWETMVQDVAIICDGFRFPVTRNLLSALQNLRKPKGNLLIWIDQICINQRDDSERGHQVNIMKHIYSKARSVTVWLGEGDDRSQKFCEAAKRMRRGEEGTKSALRRLISPRQLQDTMGDLLRCPWFQRVWVIPEVALAPFTVVAWGRSLITWDNLVQIIRDVQVPPSVSFSKQVDLLGNPRQRIAIITQMIAAQRESLARTGESLAHTDITQLLILAKGSQATDHRDKVYAFYALTLLTTFPDYKRSTEELYVDIARYYVDSIEACYSGWQLCSEAQRSHQLMSIICSSGVLHQHYTLPSWVPDWTFNWHLSPIFLRTSPNFGAGSSYREDWTAAIRCEYRAGGDKRQTFEVLSAASGMHQLRVSAIIFDKITVIQEMTPASTPGIEEVAESSSDASESPAMRYGRSYFNTAKGHIGLATPGVRAGDVLAIFLGGDVPLVLRSQPDAGRDNDKAYKLLCECFVRSDMIMYGELARTSWASAEDVILT